MGRIYDYIGARDPATYDLAGIADVELSYHYRIYYRQKLQP